MAKYCTQGCPLCPDARDIPTSRDSEKPWAWGFYSYAPDFSQCAVTVQTSGMFNLQTVFGYEGFTFYTFTSTLLISYNGANSLDKEAVGQ